MVLLRLPTPVPCHGTGNNGRNQKHHKNCQPRPFDCSGLFWCHNVFGDFTSPPVWLSEAACRARIFICCRSWSTAIAWWWIRIISIITLCVVVGLHPLGVRKWSSARKMGWKTASICMGLGSRLGLIESSIVLQEGSRSGSSNKFPRTIIRISAWSATLDVPPEILSIYTTLHASLLHVITTHWIGKKLLPILSMQRAKWLD